MLKLNPKPHIIYIFYIIGSGIKTCRTNRSIADKIRYSSIEIHNSITKLSQGIGDTVTFIYHIFIESKDLKMFYKHNTDPIMHKYLNFSI